MRFLLFVLAWGWWINSFSILSWIVFILAFTLVFWGYVDATLKSDQKRRKQKNYDLAKAIVAIVENAERREVRWRIGMRREFHMEDPQ